MYVKDLTFVSILHDDSLYERTKGIFQELNCRFNNYKSPVAAGQYFDWKVPDVVIIEVTSETEPTFAFLEKIRKMPDPVCKTPFLFIIPNIISWDRTRVFSNKYVDYILKPFSAPEIITKLENLIKSQVIDSVNFKNEDLFEEIVAIRTSKFYEILNMSVLLNSERDLDKLLHTAVTKVTKIMDADRSSLFIYDKDCDELWSRVAEGLDTVTIRLPKGKGVAGKVFDRGTPLLVHDVTQNPDFDNTWDKKIGFNTKSLLCYPIKNRDGELKGVLQVLNAEVDKFHASDMAMAEACASQIGVALENFEFCTGYKKSI